MNKSYSNGDMYVYSALNVSELKFLTFAVLVAAVSPLISSIFGIPIAVTFSAATCVMIWTQEVFIIQIKYREENIEFTRRFRERYSPKNAFMLGFIPHILSLVIIIYVLLEIGGNPSIYGWFILFFCFFALVRIFDPLLGCISTYEPISWSSILAYLVIFTFATSSAIDPSKLDFYPFPGLVMQSLLFSVIIFTILNLRFAYYQKYCFLQESSIDSQLKLILLPLLFLSIHQVLTIINTLDFSSILNR